MVKHLQDHDDRYRARNAYERRYGRDITREESWAMLDEWCREYLSIGVDEFARRYHAGEYDDPDDNLKIMQLAMRLEFLERNPPNRQQRG